MTKWEYKTFTSTGGLRIAVEESSSMGEDGWELVTINYCNDYREWVLHIQKISIKRLINLV